MATPDYENMSVAELEKLLDDRRIKFVHELLIDGNQTAAAVRAGYSEKTAASQASRLLRDVKVAAYKRALARELLSTMGYDKSQLLLKLGEIVDRCMEGKPHLGWDAVKREWVPDGTWTFDSRGAVKAIEAIAAMAGFNESKKVSIENESIEQFLAALGGGGRFK